MYTIYLVLCTYMNFEFDAGGIVLQGREGNVGKLRLLALLLTNGKGAVLGEGSRQLLLAGGQAVHLLQLLDQIILEIQAWFMEIDYDIQRKE